MTKNIKYAKFDKRNHRRRSVSHLPRRRRKRSGHGLAVGMLEQAAKSGSFFFLSSDKRKVVSKIVETGYVPSPDQGLANAVVAALAGMHKSHSRYCPSHPFESRDSECLLSELATSWKAGSGFPSALSRLATPGFIHEESLLSS